MKEEWRVIPGFPAYRISSLGRIHGTRGFKKCQINEHGYLTVMLSKNSKSFSRTVHGLVALAFIGPRPRKRKVVNHKNGNKLDPSITNLEYLTPRENSRHAVDTGLTVALRGSAQASAIVDESLIPLMFEDAANGMQRRALAKKYKIQRSTVDNILLRHSWRHVPVSNKIIQRVRTNRKHRNMGTNNPLAKLNPEKVTEIFRLAKGGMKLDDIATIMENSRSGISQVLHRNVWAHVKIPKPLLPRVKPSRRLEWS